MREPPSHMCLIPLSTCSPQGQTYSLSWSWIGRDLDQVQACTQTPGNNIGLAWTLEVFGMRLRHAGRYNSQCLCSTDILLSITFDQRLSLSVRVLNKNIIRKPNDLRASTVYGLVWPFKNSEQQVQLRLLCTHCALHTMLKSLVSALRTLS